MMPVVKIDILSGKTKEQKQKMVEGVTAAINEATGVTPEKIWIIINDVEAENWANNGKLKTNQ